jgi:L-Ala-D/L-Glu epimerase / N-acetyl-D-glutamate racemase
MTVAGAPTVRWQTVDLPLRRPFRIARSTQESFEVVEVVLEAGGATGFGEATPDPRFGEDVGSVTAFLERAEALLGSDPFALEETLARLRGPGKDLAAVAAIDAALHDLCGKLAGLSVQQLLGVPSVGPATAFTISLDDPDEMAREAESALASGLRRLKLKLGGRDGRDADRVASVRAVTDAPLQVDANEAWEFAEALELIPGLSSLGVEFVEQPLPAGSPDGAELKQRSCLPIYVDEDCCVLEDVAACAERAHGINIKLAKAGGIREALRMVHAARALRLGVMIGCMGESSLAIAAACPVASLCDYVDLDGNLLIADDPWDGVELGSDGEQRPSGRPGLGVWRRA